MKTKQIKKRLEYLRKELRAERISYGELAELESLKEYIEPGDIELLQAAGVEVFPLTNNEKMNTAKWVCEITVIDPDTRMPVELCVYKHEQNGGMFAIDSAFVDQVLGDEDDEDDINVRAVDPLSSPTSPTLVLLTEY